MAAESRPLSLCQLDNEPNLTTHVKKRGKRQDRERRAESGKVEVFSMGRMRPGADKGGGRPFSSHIYVPSI